jgi:hypothetical protein
MQGNLLCSLLSLLVLVMFLCDPLQLAGTRYEKTILNRNFPGAVSSVSTCITLLSILIVSVLFLTGVNFIETTNDSIVLVSAS